MIGKSGGKGKAIFELPVRCTRYLARICLLLLRRWQALLLKKFR